MRDDEWLPLADDSNPVDLARRLHRTLDTLEIQTTLARYARGVDRDDWDLLRSCYTDDAVDEHGRYNGDIDGLVAWLQLEMPRYESSMHVIANSTVEVQRPVATAETYCVAFHRLHPDDDGVQVDRVVGVRYLDKFRLVDGRWLISHRTCVYEWSRIELVPPGSQLDAAYVRGRRGRTDPSYGVLFLPGGSADREKDGTGS
jgi:hypothetical protein